MTGDDLLAAIEADIEDVNTWLAYADWLQDHDAPRGELITLDIALESELRPELEVRRAELLTSRAPALLGGTFAKVVAEGYGGVTWRRGFVDTLAYTGKTVHPRAIGWLLDVICDQFPEPFTFLRRLDLYGTDLADLERLARFTHLAELSIGRTRVTELAPLATMLPRLRRLDVAECKADIKKLHAARPELAIGT